MQKATFNLIGMDLDWLLLMTIESTFVLVQ